MTPLSSTNDNKRRRILEEDFEFVWTAGDNTFRMTVPAGYDYEVSGPLLSQVLLITIGPYYAGEDVSLGHDWGYRHRGDVDVEVKTENGQWRRLARKLTKWEVDEMMTADPQDPRRVKMIMREGVRLFGWWKWYDWDLWVNNLLGRLFGGSS